MKFLKDLVGFQFIIKCMLLCAIILISTMNLVVSKELNIETSLGVGMLSGDTTYQIGGQINGMSGSGRVHFPISELEFPLNVYMATFSFHVGFFDNFKLKIDAKKNITTDAGKMKDSDWGTYWLETYDNPNAPPFEQQSFDVYSESDAELNALIIDTSISYKLGEVSKWLVAAGIGYIYKEYNFNAGNLDQWSPSYSYYKNKGYLLYDPFLYSNSGKVLTYDITYSIPYISLSIEKIFSKLCIETEIGYSPLVSAKDKDHHLVRDPPKISEGDCNGSAILLSFAGQYNFAEQWYLSINLNYTTINTTGEQRQSFSDGTWFIVDQEITNMEFLTDISIGYSF